jgi:transposase InsO family protein
VHVCVDDTSRLAYVEVLSNETATTTVGFLARATTWFANRGVTIQRVMTDNGSPYRSTAWATWCADHHVRHLRTRPYRPRTNGKAERFIQTMLREWCYAATYQSSQHRTDALPAWLDYYNNHRPHSDIGHRTPASALDTDLRCWDLHLAVPCRGPRPGRPHGPGSQAPGRQQAER